MPQDRSNKQRTLLKLKEPSWKKNSAIWKPSISTRKTHYSPVPNNSPPCLLIFGFSGSEQFPDPPFYLDSPVYWYLGYLLDPPFIKTPPPLLFGTGEYCQNINTTHFEIQWINSQWIIWNHLQGKLSTLCIKV